MDGHRQETASMANQAVDEMKYKAEVEEYVEDGRSAMAADFQQKEAALRRKLDWYIAPVMMLCMLISYLDRGNIGFAATQGMSEEIGLTGNQLNVSGGTPEQVLSLTRSTADCCFHFLCHLRVGGISNVFLRQASPVPQSHSGHHLLLGIGLHVLRIHTQFRRPMCDQTYSRLVRRVRQTTTNYRTNN